MPFVELSHTADMRIKVYADSIPALFKDGFYALYSIIFGKVPLCEAKEHDTISIQSSDIDILFHDFLDEILYLTFAKRRKICKLSLKISEDTIVCDYFYKTFEPEKEAKIEVKAITYHNLHIQKKDNLYETEVIMDV